MGSTAVPPIQWTSTGVVLPTDAEILTGVQTDLDNAFGGGLNPSLSTPQGQLASSEAAIIAEKNSEIAYIVNQINPLYSSGPFQDAIGQLYFMTRNPAVATVVIATLGGLPGTNIPAGALALDTSGNVYTLLNLVTIGPSGTVQAEFANVATGPIPCAAGALSQIYKTIPGWDTITNASAGILGADVESPQAFESRREKSVALNSHGTTDTIFANVYAVSGVLDCYVIDNPSGATVNYGSTNYPLAPHSVYIAVVGGSASAIAQAIWMAKDAGCSYSAWPTYPSGSTVPGQGSVETSIVYDTRYAAPQPAYGVSFIIPASVPVYFAVTIQSAANLPTNYVSLIQNAIIAQFNGQNGTTPAGIASLILASSYYGPILTAVTGITLVSVLVGLTSPGAAYDVQMGIDQQPTLQASNITVTVL